MLIRACQFDTALEVRGDSRGLRASAAGDRCGEFGILMRWTNDHWVSTAASRRQPAERLGERRISIPSSSRPLDTS